MTLSPKLGVVEISTLWHFRLPLPLQIFIKVASAPRLSGIGMTSPILWSHPLKMQRIVLLSSLLWWELETNSLITGHGEWLSFRRFTSKLSWSLSWSESSLGAHHFVAFVVLWLIFVCHYWAVRVIYINVHTLYVPSKTLKTLPGEGKKGWTVELHVRSAFLLIVLFHMALF